MLNITAKIVDTLHQEMHVEHEGAVAFEYVIILCVMAVACFTVWGTLGNQVIQKANEISNFIANNGTQAMGTTQTARGDTGTFLKN